MNAEPKRVFILDDHPFFRAGLRLAIEMESDLEIRGEAEKGRHAAAKIIDAKTDVALIDLTLKDYHGINVIKDLRANGYEGNILVISMHNEDFYAERILEAGAQGYVSKDEAPNCVVDAIRQISSGGVYLSPRAQRKIMERFGKANPPQSEWMVTPRVLSDRQLEVFESIGQGLSTEEISERLGIDEKTVQTHHLKIKKRLGLDTMRQLIRYAVTYVNSPGGPLSPGADEN